MLITDKFIFINLPKTGSTFVRNVMKRIHADSTQTIKYKPNVINYFKNFVFNKPKDLTVLYVQNKRENAKRRNNWEEHGIYSQIPKKVLKNRKVVSVMRNPFERYVSLFTYGDWKKNIPLNFSELKQQFPNFPNLDFKEFVISREFYKSILSFSTKKKLTDNLGILTLQFIQFFADKPEVVLYNLQEKGYDFKVFKQYFKHITFLNTPTLNQDLYDLLKNSGYQKKNIDFILDEQKHNMSRKETDSWERYYDSESINYVKDKEKLLFQFFSDFDFSYPSSSY